MNKYLMCLVLAVLCTGAGCKKEKSETATLVTDCTGTYLRVNEKDYKVCNLSLVQGIANNTQVEVSFKTRNVCNTSFQPDTTCKLYHQYEAWAEITAIR